MKRLISLIAIAMLLICMNAPLAVFAAPGEDAHSGTMAVEADGESVQEKQAKEQDVADEIVDVDVAEEELQEQLDESADEDLVEGAEESSDNLLDAMSNNWLYITAGLGVVVLLIVIIINVKRL